MVVSLTPPRRRGREFLDEPDVDPRIVCRSLDDVALANRLFGGARAVLAELDPLFARLTGEVTLLDVGTGCGDIPARARALAQARGVVLNTIGLDAAEELAATSRARTTAAVCADALHLPFADRSVDIVLCSQVLHHFVDDHAACRLVREMNRVARVRVIVSDLRRSWLAVAGIWLASFPLRFHAVSRHDGVVSVMRGFTPDELRDSIARSLGREPVVRRRAGFRVTASWAPEAGDA
jgi:SAM-dependent methyltransferase